MNNPIMHELEQHFSLHQAMLDLAPAIHQAAEMIRGALERGNKVFFMGNGGSAADAQHLAAEFIGRFRKERKGLPGLALTTDTSALTAIGNDYGYEQVFSRQLQALSQPRDLVIAISTSGNSPNIIKALQSARSLGVERLGLAGKDGGLMKEQCDLCLVMPSNDTARIQEMHILIGHILCAEVDSTNQKDHE